MEWLHINPSPSSGPRVAPNLPGTRIVCRYSGQWQESLKHGVGRYQLADGTGSWNGETGHRMFVEVLRIGDLHEWLIMTMGLSMHMNGWQWLIIVVENHWLWEIHIQAPPQIGSQIACDQRIWIWMACGYGSPIMPKSPSQNDHNLGWYQHATGQTHLNWPIN